MQIPLVYRGARRDRVPPAAVRQNKAGRTEKKAGGNSGMDFQEYNDITLRVFREQHQELDRLRAENEQLRRDLAQTMDELSALRRIEGKTCT
jgi:hypothetical protein